MSRNNIGRTSLKMKLLGMLDRKLTVGYVNDYLRGKGIATLEHDDCWLTFKLYDLDWLLLCKDGRFGIRCTFTLREDTHMESMLKAVNTLNDERYVVKAYLCGGSCKDEDGATVKNEPLYKDIVFSFESFCYTESCFPELYETAIYITADAIDSLRKLYNEYKDAQAAAVDNPPKVGFNRAAGQPGQQDAAPAGMSGQERKRIGFSQM